MLACGRSCRLQRSLATLISVESSQGPRIAAPAPLQGKMLLDRELGLRDEKTGGLLFHHARSRRKHRAIFCEPNPEPSATLDSVSTVYVLRHGSLVHRYVVLHGQV